MFAVMCIEQLSAIYADTIDLIVLFVTRRPSRAYKHVSGCNAVSYSVYVTV